MFSAWIGTCGIVGELSRPLPGGNLQAHNNGSLGGGRIREYSLANAQSSRHKFNSDSLILRKLVLVAIQFDPVSNFCPHEM